MSEQHLEIDITKTQDENNDEDLIDIGLGEEKHFKVNFSKLVSQSKYIRDKYKYSEAIISLTEEILLLQKRTKINDDLVEQFVKYIQTGKVTISYEDFYSMYKLSKTFEITRLTHELETIIFSKMCEDLTFSIETLISSEGEQEEIDNDLLAKIETFLSERMNESLSNKHFCRLPVSTIYRILEKSDKKFVNINVLTDFIFESIESRFVLLKFVKLHKI